MVSRDYLYPVSGVLAAGERTVPVAEDDSTTLQIPRSAVPGELRESSPAAETYKVNGKEVAYTYEQRAELIQKAAAADEKFREAALMRKEAESASVLRSDLEAIIQDGDVDAFRRMGAAMGLPGHEVEAAAAKIWGDGSDDEFEEEEEVVRQPARRQDGKVDFAQLPHDVQRLLIKQEKDRITGIIHGTLDKNEKIRYNMEQYDEKGREQIKALVEEKVRGRLNSTNGDFGDGTHILREVLPEVESLLEALASSRRQLPGLSMGAAPSGGDLQVYPKKRPDHVRSTSGGWEENILQHLAYNMANAQQGQ